MQHKRWTHKSSLSAGIGCGSVGRVVTSGTSNQQFVSVIGKFYLLSTLFLKNGPNSGLILFIFVFSTWLKSILIDKGIDGVLGTRTWGSRMEGANKSTELWRHPSINCVESMIKDAFTTGKSLDGIRTRGRINQSAIYLGTSLRKSETKTYYDFNSNVNPLVWKM